MIPTTFGPKAYVGYARIRLTVRKSWREDPGDATTEKEKMMSTDRTELLDKLSPEAPHEAANVAMSVNSKISDSVYWGDGAWDKIPFSVEVFSSVSLCCGQSEKEIKRAQEIAYDLAWEASREALGTSFQRHVTDIRERLFPELFSD